MTAIYEVSIERREYLFSLIQRCIPNAQSYTIEDNIKQANAEGFDVTVPNSDPASSKERLFIKTVSAHNYAHKPWDDLRRTLLYARTETRFYSEILPLLQAKTSWDIAPKCFLAETSLEGLIGDHETASAKEINSEEDPRYNEADTALLEGKGGQLVLECLHSKDFFQTSPLLPEQAIQCLEAIARFHATAYEDEVILRKVADRLCEYGGSYHLKNRNPKELANMESTWSDFSEEIRSVAPTLFDRQPIRDLGKRIKNAAEFISEELSPSYDDKHATVVHGDYKAMNVFLRRDGSVQENKDWSLPILIDYASTGIGMGMSDVAMHITHAVPPEYLVNGGEERLVLQYLDALEEAMPDSFEYPRNVAMYHYRLAVVDYFRFILGRLWRGATLKTFANRKDSKNVVYVNRSIEAAINFIERAETYLTEIEKVKEGMVVK